MVCDITQTRSREWPDLKKGIFYGLNKNHWVDFYHYKVVVYTHGQQTFMFKQHVKVNFATDDPLRETTSAET